MTTDPARDARLDQLYAELDDTLARLAPILARYRDQLTRAGFTDEEAGYLCAKLQDALIAPTLDTPQL